MSESPRPPPYISRTKLTAPATSRYEVLRHAMLDRVDTGQTHLAVLVHAPAGFGKTTFMTQLQARYRQAGFATLWLTLDEGDNDLSRFLSSFSTALAGLHDAPPQAPRVALRNSDLVQSILEQLAASPNPVAVFLDDFEAIHNPVVLAVVTRGLELITHQACLVIGSRTLPNIGLARLRARGTLTEIDAKGLRFSPEETREYLIARRATGLSAAQVQHLQNRTEGWVTALWLASLALEHHDNADRFLDAFCGNHAAITAYLAEDVLVALPEALREFLLRSSVLEELSPALCNAVCNTRDSVAILQELERRQLFLVPIDTQQNLYRYHALFRDCLRHQLRRDFPERLAGLHRAACTGYLAEGRAIPAIQHALLAGDTTQAVGLLEQHVDTLLGQSRLRLLAGYIGQLPDDELARHPRLYLIRAWCTAFTAGPKEALALVEQIDSRQLTGEPAAYLKALRPLLLGMMDRIAEAHALGMQALDEVGTAYPFAWAMLHQVLSQTSIILGLHAQAHAFVEQARRTHSDSVSTFGFVLSESAEALLDMMAGRLRQTLARLRLAANLLQPARHLGNGNAPAAIQLAEALYEANQCEEALHLLTVYTPLVQDLGLSDALITAYTLLARMAHAKGDRDRALQLLTELQAIGHRLGQSRISASARLERSIQHLADGDLRGALEQLNLAQNTFAWNQTSTYWFIANDTLNPAIVQLRYQIRSGLAHQAIAPLRSQLAQAEHAMRGRRALKLRILMAEALHRDGQAKLALRTLERAFQFAKVEGFVRSFIDEGAVIQAMLNELQALPPGLQAPGERNVERRVGSVPAPPPAATLNTTLAEPLTSQEMKVLALLGLGLSNAQMAEKLFVSDSTVRTHLRNINLKLQASSRNQALAIARRMGLCS